MTWVARAKRFLSGVAFVALLAVLATGCYYDAHGFYFPFGYYYQDDFDFGGDFFDYTSVDEFLWDNIYDEAYVEFIADNFDGEITIEVYDDHDELVYLATYIGFGDDEYELDLTSHGDEGDWFIRITSVSVFGEVDIFIY